MIDFDKEEFLQRLDVRLGAISAMLAYHEKFIADIRLKADKYREVEKYINKAQTVFLNYIVNTDKKISEQFLLIKAEFAKGNGENE
mgnify:CR=1 FL=1